MVRIKNNFYIDKTDLIREWWESDGEVMLIARTRRFGKTLVKGADGRRKKFKMVLSG